jgi:protein N-terminal glutamine amidohydrolase
MQKEKSLPPLEITPGSCIYTSCYCEENVYKLCKTLSETELFTEKKIEIYAVFISNPEKKSMIQMQKKGDPIRKFMVCWDYHVILLLVQPAVEDSPRKSFVYDLDSQMDFPCEFNVYYSKCINFKKKFDIFFRVVPCVLYLKHFASDRSHMISNGKYMAEPPKYDKIVNELGIKMNIQKYWDMENKEEIYGKVYSQKGFQELFKT